MSTIPEDYEPPGAQIIGETEVTIECAVSDACPDICSGWSETVELEEPAHYGEHGEKVILPDYHPECEECGNPHVYHTENPVIARMWERQGLDVSPPVDVKGKMSDSGGE